MFWLVYLIAYGWGMFHGYVFLLFTASTHINTSKQVDQQSVWRNTSLRKSFKKTPKQWWSLHNGLGSLHSWCRRTIDNIQRLLKVSTSLPTQADHANPYHQVLQNQGQSWPLWETQVRRTLITTHSYWDPKTWIRFNAPSIIINIWRPYH